MMRLSFQLYLSNVEIMYILMIKISNALLILV